MYSVDVFEVPSSMMFSFPLPVPEFIDPVFEKTSPKRSFLVIEYERFVLVFAKSGSINSATAGDRCEGRFPFDTRHCNRKGVSLSTVKSVDLRVYPCVPRAQKKETQAPANCSAVPTQLALCLRLAIDL